MIIIKKYWCPKDLWEKEIYFSIFISLVRKSSNFIGDVIFYFVLVLKKYNNNNNNKIIIIIISILELYEFHCNNIILNQIFFIFHGKSILKTNIGR
jgi:hypothetical protein